jgi:hypothetical protein
VQNPTNIRASSVLVIVVLLELLLILFLRLDELLAPALHRRTVAARNRVAICVMSGHWGRLLERLVAIRVLCRRSAITLLLLLGIGVSTITASSGGCSWGSVGLLIFVVAVVG